MVVKWGRRRFIAKRSLDAGMVVRFNYKGDFRYGVVIAPEYKDNCDCYFYDGLDEIPIELLMYIAEADKLYEGDLWKVFGNLDQRYRSFKRNQMIALQSIEFVMSEEPVLPRELNENDTTDYSGTSVENV